MKVALLVLKSGVTLISYTDELEYEPKCHLFKPCTFTGKTKVTFSLFPQGAADEHILLNSSDLLTACAPLPELEAAYVKKVGAAPKTTKPMMLTEDEIVPEEYEPRYVENERPE